MKRFKLLLLIASFTTGLSASSVAQARWFALDEPVDRFANFESANHYAEHLLLARQVGTRSALLSAELTIDRAPKEPLSHEQFEQHFHGKVLAYKPPTDNSAGSITLLVKTKTALHQANRKLTYAVPPSASVTQNTKVVTFSDVRVGDTVGLSVLRNAVVNIDVFPPLQKHSE